MPVYAYACTSCSSAFDARQGFDEPALTVCEACGGALRKQYGTVGVTFKGSGFYRTDSRATARSGGDASASGSKGSGESSSKTSSDSAAAKPSSSPQPAAKTSAATSGGAGTVA